MVSDSINSPYHHYQGVDILKERLTPLQASKLEERIKRNVRHQFSINKEGFVYLQNPGVDYPKGRTPDNQQFGPLPLAKIRKGREQTRFTILNTEIFYLKDYHHSLREEYWLVV